jgi:hypothetical protein
MRVEQVTEVHSARQFQKDKGEKKRKAGTGHWAGTRQDEMVGKRSW